MNYLTMNSTYNSTMSVNVTTNASMTFCDYVQMSFGKIGPQLAHGVAMAIAAVGVVGNLLSVVVLSTQKPRTVYLMMLLVLSVADELISCCTVIYTATHFVVYRHCRSGLITYATYRYIDTVVMFIHDVAQLFSNWVLIVMTVDRYLAINRPFAGGFSKKLAGLVLGLTALGCILFSLPRLLFLAGVMERMAALQEPLEILVRYFLPLLLLAVLNGRLLFYIRHAQQEHSELTGRRRDPNRSVTVILILVVVVFLLCGTTRGVYIVIKTINPRLRNDAANKVTWILMVVNSSINFMIYVLFYKRFRTSLRDLILKPCRPPRKRYSDFTSNSKSTLTTNFSMTQTKSLLEE